VQALRPDRVAFHAGLIRVLDPQGRPLPEAEVAAAVEATATGRELDRLALRLGLEALAAGPGLRLSVGMSARSIGYPRWTRALREGLMRDRTVGERLILEIPERSALLLPDLVAGYTALRHLTELRFDLLKLDGGLVRGVARHPQNQVLIRALATVAATFDIFTLAPSVDRGEDADWLTGAGIDCLQGSYFAAPTMHPPWVSLGPRAQA
jgi:EAL domain-containing protein (putative c-di-GMP-specific phosphodiesterase class I)